MSSFATRGFRVSAATRRPRAVEHASRPATFPRNIRLLIPRLRTLRWLAFAAAIPVAIGMAQRPAWGQLILKKRPTPSVAARPLLMQPRESRPVTYPGSYQGNYQGSYPGSYPGNYPNNYWGQYSGTPPVGTSAASSNAYQGGYAGPYPGETVIRDTAVDAGSSGPVAPGYLGMTAEEDPRTNALTVVIVKGNSPAERAGIRVGDQLLAIEGRAVRSLDQFAQILESRPAGSRVSFELARNGQRQAVLAVLTKRAAPKSRTASSGSQLAQLPAPLPPPTLPPPTSEESMAPTLSPPSLSPPSGSSYGGSNSNSAPSVVQSPPSYSPQPSPSPPQGNGQPMPFGQPPPNAPQPQYGQSPPYAPQPQNGQPPQYAQQPQYAQPPQYAPQQPQYGQQPQFAQQPPSGQQPQYWQPPAAGTQPGYGPPPSQGAPSGYGPGPMPMPMPMPQSGPGTGGQPPVASTWPAAPSGPAVSGPALNGPSHSPAHGTAQPNGLPNGVSPSEVVRELSDLRLQLGAVQSRMSSLESRLREVPDSASPTGEPSSSPSSPSGTSTPALLEPRE